jgi:hypothetical protein
MNLKAQSTRHRNSHGKIRYAQIGLEATLTICIETLAFS